MDTFAICGIVEKGPWGKKLLLHKDNELEEFCPKGSIERSIRSGEEVGNRCGRVCMVQILYTHM